MSRPAGGLVPRTIRGRVAAGVVVAIALAMAILGGSVLTLVDRGLRSTVDDGLRGRATEIVGIASTTPAILDAPGALDSAAGGRALFVEIVDANGAIEHRSLTLGGRVLPADDLVARARAEGRAVLADRRLGGEPVRVLALPISSVPGSDGGVVIVAANVGDIDGNVDRTRQIVLVATLLAAIAGLAAALLLVRRALRPLTRLTAGAEAIVRSGDGGARLPEPGSDDEVGRLAAALNRMLRSLDASRERERRFVADASHELRTPLTALRGNAAYLARHGGDGVEAEALAELVADADRLARTLDDLLVLTREDAAAPPVDIVRLDLLAGRIGAAAGATVTAPRAVAVVGDEAALERAVANLLENARTHGPAGGAIRVAVTARAGHALLQVEDDGDGLVGEAATHAFERFWRAPEASARPGSGLGLAIVRATAERHGGRVFAQRGRFTLDLPETTLTDVS